MRPSASSVVKAACADRGWSVDRLFTRYEKLGRLEPRTEVVGIARDVTACSFPELGRAVGNKGHAGVYALYRRWLRDVPAMRRESMCEAYREKFGVGR